MISEYENIQEILHSYQTIAFQIDMLDQKFHLIK